MLQLAGGHDQIAGTFCRFPRDHGQRIGFILNCILLYIWYLIMCSDTSDETKITSKQVKCSSGEDNFKGHDIPD